MIDRYWESEKKKQDRKDLLRSLRAELAAIKGTPSTEGIYPDIWDSVISSGKLSDLLISEQILRLTDIYKGIREVNYERRRIDLRARDQILTHETHTVNLNQKIERILQDKELWEEG